MQIKKQHSTQVNVAAALTLYGCIFLSEVKPYFQEVITRTTEALDNATRSRRSKGIKDGFGNELPSPPVTHSERNLRMSWRNSPTRTPDPVYEQVEDLAEESTRSLLENENPKVPDLTEKQLDDLLFNATTNSNSAFQMAGLTYRLVGQNSRIHLVLVGLLGLNSVLLVAVLIMLAG